MAVGDQVRLIANAYGWKIAKRTVLVEGDTDERYLRKAAGLVAAAGGPSLLDGDFSVASCGSGDQGGIPNLKERFITIRQIADNIDRNAAGGPKAYHFLALFDGDSPGKKGARSLDSQVARFAIGRDIIILQPEMPELRGSADNVRAAIASANAGGKAVDCVIEDLVDDAFFDLFVDDDLGGSEVICDRVDGVCHRRLTTPVKARLCRYFEQHAEATEMNRFIQLLRALRAYSGAPPK